LWDLWDVGWAVTSAYVKVNISLRFLFTISPICEALKILVPMDSGRYADVLINITAAVLIFFLPGGYTLPLFIALALSHLSLGV
jgi:hypothetical protein